MFDHRHSASVSPTKKDAYSARYSVERGLEMVSPSPSPNLWFVWRERGSFTIVVKSPEAKNKIESRFVKAQRAVNSSPPAYAPDSSSE
ncbi:hypothetical protein CPC16_010193 [Podila verticillata]|nr:hypothetical protein CPC16_010193 [Podila verticillata]